MSQTAIPLQFEKYLRDKVSLGKAPQINEMIFAYIPDLDPSQPIDRSQGLPPMSQWVYQRTIDQVGKMGDNALAYSVVVPDSEDAFTFNAIFMRDKDVPDSCAFVVHKADETKEVGSTLTRTLVMEFDGAAELAGIHVDAETWQIDYSARLLGMDEDLRLACFDIYGHTAYINGFDVSRHTDPNKYIISAGVVYVGGLRFELPAQLVQTVIDKPATLYVEVYRDGTALSVWKNHGQVIASQSPMANYTNANGRPHYVTKLARINSDGSIEDLRQRGGLQAHLDASHPHKQYAQKTELEQFAQRSLLTAKDFVKSTAWEAAFTVTGGVVRTACDIAVIVGDRVVTASANEIIDTPTLVIGVDYAIYATHDGLLVSSNFTVPNGYTESNSRRIGGFHYGDGEFKTHSFYDLHFRPRARDPRGMVLDMGERFWADIYLTNTTPDLLGTSAYDAQIADGGSAPKVPEMLGGDGVQQYSDYSQITASELLACYGKRLPYYHEQTALAYGAQTGYALGSDPTKTLFDSNARSLIGCEQAVGHMWQWGAEIWDRGNGNSGYNWYDLTGGFGQVYLTHNEAAGSTLYGGYWKGVDVNGARSVDFSREPWHTGDSRSSRGICNHCLVV